MAEPEVPLTAVVVTYESAATVTQMLQAAERSHAQRLLECVVVDNGSRDRTVDIVARQFPWVDVVRTGTNNGFGRGCNIGLARVRTPYTLFVNPDAVVEPEAVRSMLALLEERPEVGIVGPAIVEGDPGAPGVLQQTGPRPTPLELLRAAWPSRRPSVLSHPIEPGSAGARTGWVCGAVLMARTDLLRRLQGFDPRFFLYWEETDLCKRAEDLGYEIWALGAAVARHVGGASSSSDDTRIGGCIARHYFQSRFYYMVKHHGWLAASVAEGGEFLLRSSRAFVDAVRGRGLGWLRSRLQAPLFSQPDRPSP